MTDAQTPWGILTGIRPAKIATKMLQSGTDEQEVLRYFTQSCGTTEEKAALALAVAKTELPIRQAIYEDGVSIYIGIPFCPTRCLYCSFVTNGTRQAAKLIPDYLACLKREIAYTAELVRHGQKRVETVYIGGGTPTTLDAGQLRELLDTVRASFDLTALKEFTVEAGRPDTVTQEKLAVLSEAGVDRISINPQSMHTKTLQTIGRAHTPQQIIDAVSLARTFNFQAINMDIIAGLPGEDFEMFCGTLDAVAALEPENITVHTMSIKRSSRLHEYLDDYTLTQGETVARMVSYARQFLADRGLQPYYLYRQKNQLGNLENVGYAKPGLEGLYNIYIMEEIQTILSLGCGGVTKTVDRAADRIERIFNVKEPKDYIERIDEMLARKSVLMES